MLGHLWDFVTSNWVADVVGLIDDAIRHIPYALLFLLGFIIVQCLMACHASVELGGVPAARALVHGGFLDSAGLCWSLGLATVLVAWKWLAKITLKSRQ